MFNAFNMQLWLEVEFIGVAVKMHFYHTQRYFHFFFSDKYNNSTVTEYVRFSKQSE